MKTLTLSVSCDALRKLRSEQRLPTIEDVRRQLVEAAKITPDLWINPKLKRRR